MSENEDNTIMEDTEIKTEDDKAVNDETVKIAGSENGTVEKGAPGTDESSGSAETKKPKSRTKRTSRKKSENPEEKETAAAPKKSSSRAHSRTVVGRLNAVAENALADDIASGKILSIDGQLKASTESQFIRETVEDLAQSFANRTPLTATISEIYTPKEGTPRPVAIYKAFRIYFDPSDFMDMTKLSQDESIRYKQIRAHLNRRIGSEIDFVVKDAKGVGIKAINETAHIAAGDRSAAMLQKRHAYWEPDSRDRSVIEEGSKVEARVVMVRPTLMIVEVFGVEISVPIEEVSYTYMEDLTRESPYKVGDYVNVLITHISRDENLFKARASIKMLCENKQLEEARRMEALLEAHNSVTQFGKIVRVTIVNVFVRLDSGAVLRCPQHNDGRRAVAGDYWAVKVSHADSASGRMEGFLTYFVK